MYMQLPATSRLYSAFTIVTYDLDARPSSTPNSGATPCPIFEPADVDIKETLGNEKLTKILLGGENGPTTEPIYSKSQ